MTLAEFNDKLQAEDFDAYLGLDDARDQTMLIDGHLTLADLERIVALWKELRGEN